MLRECRLTSVPKCQYLTSREKDTKIYFFTNWTFKGGNNHYDFSLINLRVALFSGVIEGNKLLSTWPHLNHMTFRTWTLGLMCVCVCVCALTFVLADLYISKEANLDNLPEQTQDQMGFPSHQIMGVDAHHHTADRWGRVQSQDQILLQIQMNHWFIIWFSDSLAE